MVKLTASDKEDLERAVTAAEKRTSAEIVLSVAEMCDDYRIYVLPYAALFGLLVFAGLALFMPDFHIRMAFLVTGGATLAAALALQWPPLRLFAAPRAVREEAAEHAARVEFTALVAGRTSAANGVLVFVALAERHAEILPEPGLAARVAPDVWRTIMDTLVADLAAGHAMTGLRTAVEACGEAAAAAFPAAPDDRNELSNAPQIARP